MLGRKLREDRAFRIAATLAAYVFIGLMAAGILDKFHPNLPYMQELFAITLILLALQAGCQFYFAHQQGKAANPRQTVAIMVACACGIAAALMPGDLRNFLSISTFVSALIFISIVSTKQRTTQADDKENGETRP